jgi:ABC-type antimicrobial peptide transport system permease subunit
VIGLLAAIGFTALLRGFLYGIGPTDPLTYAQVLLLFGAIMLLAGFFPARRAASVSPAVSLQHTQG